MMIVEENETDLDLATNRDPPLLNSATNPFLLPNSSNNSKNQSGENISALQNNHSTESVSAASRLYSPQKFKRYQSLREEEETAEDDIDSLPESFDSSLTFNSRSSQFPTSYKGDKRRERSGSASNTAETAWSKLFEFDTRSCLSNAHFGAFFCVNRLLLILLSPLSLFEHN